MDKLDPYTAANLAELEQDKPQEVKTFTCSVCNLVSPFTYFGRKPPSVKSRLVLLEDAYVIKNPFVDPRQSEVKTVTGKPVHPILVLGSHCAVCEVPVCAAIECSYFYTQRFCKDCMSEHLSHFPDQVQKEFNKNITPKEK